MDIETFRRDENRTNCTGAFDAFMRIVFYRVFYSALLFDECSFHITVASLRLITRGGLFFFYYVVRKFHFKHDKSVTKTSVSV